MKPFSLDNLEPAEKREFLRLEEKADDTLEALKRCLSALKWCHQWITGGDDYAMIEAEVMAADAAVKKAETDQ